MQVVTWITTKRKIKEKKNHRGVHRKCTKEIYYDDKLAATLFFLVQLQIKETQISFSKNIEQ